MTSHEAWYGNKPGVEHLRVFGSTAYMNIPKEYKGKLDSKTSKCVLVGYGSVQKGYRLYNRETQQIVYSRNVKFDEGEKVKQPEEEVETPTNFKYSLNGQNSLTQWRKLLLNQGDESERGGRQNSMDKELTCQCTLSPPHWRKHKVLEVEPGNGDGNEVDDV